MNTNNVFELDDLNPGVDVYIDRTFIWTSIPALYQGQQFIRTANNDNNNTDANYLSFDINVATTVYVLLDDRATARVFQEISGGSCRLGRQPALTSRGCQEQLCNPRSIVCLRILLRQT